MNKDIIQTINKKYIRFGDIPENEVSGIWCDTIKVGEEKGVSVYDAVMIEGQWRVVLPSPIKKEVGFDLYNFIGGTENGNLPMYLVEGDYVGKGTTNEVPLSIDDSLFPDLTFEDEPLEVMLTPVTKS